MINYAGVTGENKTKHNLNWPYIPGYPFRIITIGGSGSGKMNALLTQHKDHDDYDISDKVYLYVKDPNEVKCQYITRTHEKIGLEHHKDLREYI